MVQGRAACQDYKFATGRHLSLQGMRKQLVFNRLPCASDLGTSPDRCIRNGGGPRRTNVMPFQEDSGLPDVPNLLRRGNVAHGAKDGTADTGNPLI